MALSLRLGQGIHLAEGHGPHDESCHDNIADQSELLANHESISEYACRFTRPRENESALAC